MRFTVQPIIKAKSSGTAKNIRVGEKKITPTPSSTLFIPSVNKMKIIPMTRETPIFQSFQISQTLPLTRTTKDHQCPLKKMEVRKAKDLSI